MLFIILLIAPFIYNSHNACFYIYKEVYFLKDNLASNSSTLFIKEEYTLAPKITIKIYLCFIINNIRK